MYDVVHSWLTLKNNISCQETMTTESHALILFTAGINSHEFSFKGKVNYCTFRIWGCFSRSPREILMLQQSDILDNSMVHSTCFAMSTM